MLRENSVSLKPNRGEVSTELSYTNRKTPFQSDRAFIANTSIRYGIVDWLELGATIPAGFSSRKTATGPDTSVVHDVTGFGDATIQLNARLLEQTAVLPGVVLSVGGILPTGPSPYRFERYQFNGPFGVATPNPNDSLTDFFSRNAWGTRGNLELFKTTDPLILFIGVSIDYLLSQRYNGFVVQSGLRFGYNMGFSFALSDRTTLGFTINGSYSDSLTVNGRTVANSSSEPILARLSLIQHVFTNTFLEPSIAFGLTADAPDVILSLGIRERF